MSSELDGSTLAVLEEVHLDMIRSGDLSLLSGLVGNMSAVVHATLPVRQGFFMALLAVIGDTRNAFTSGVKKESGTAMKLLVGLVLSRHEIGSEYKAMLRQVGVAEIKKLKLDRHLLSAKEGVGPASVEFIRVCLVVLHTEPKEILTTPACITRVEELVAATQGRTREPRGDDQAARRRSNTHQPGTQQPRQMGGARVRSLPTKPSVQPQLQNPLYVPGQPVSLMDIHSPSPVLLFAKHFGLGCIPKAPKWSQRIQKEKKDAEAKSGKRGSQNQPTSPLDNSGSAPDIEGDASLQSSPRSGVTSPSAAGATSEAARRVSSPQRPPAAQAAPTESESSTLRSTQSSSALFTAEDDPALLLFRRYFKPEGTLLFWGHGRCGELCTGHSSDVFTPRAMRGSSKRIVQIACGAQYSILVAEDGSLYSAGSGEWGQLGVGDPAELENTSKDNVPIQLLPTQISRFKKQDRVVRVVAGYAYAAALSESGELYLWGNNNHGQCTVGSTLTAANIRITQPLKVSMRGAPIVDVACGSFVVVALTATGIVMSWGLVSLLGLGPEEDVLRSIDSSLWTTSLAKEKRSVVMCPCRISSLDGKDVCAVTAGQWHILAVAKDGSVYSWGIGHQGRLGHGVVTQEFKPKLIEGLQGRRVTAASCGSFHSCVLDDTGAVFVFGDNASGQCGLMGKPYQLTPQQVPFKHPALQVKCGREHTAVLLADGDVMVFGSGLSTGVGLGTSFKVCTPRNILTNFVVLSIACGINHSAAMAVKRRLEFAALGALHAGPASKISSLVLKDGILCAALGAGFTIVVNRNGEAFAFGNNDWGQLGMEASAVTEKTDDDIPIATQPTRIPKLVETRLAYVAAGYAFVLAITEDARVLFWGNNNHSQSGLGVDMRNQKVIESPTEVSALTSKGVVQFACGSFFNVALTNAGDVYTWGILDCCGLGSSDVASRGIEHLLTTSSTTDARPVLAQPVKIDIAHVISVAAGQWHAIALTDDGSVFTWGVGHQGRLGHGDLTQRFVPTKIRIEERFTSIACGSFHSAAITTDDRLFMWGDNESWQCGVIDATTILVPTQVSENAQSITCGRQHSVLVSKRGTVSLSGTIAYHGRSCRCKGFDHEPQPPPITSMSGRHAIVAYSGPHHSFVLLERERPRVEVVHQAIVGMSRASKEGYDAITGSIDSNASGMGPRTLSSMGSFNNPAHNANQMDTTLETHTSPQRVASTSHMDPMSPIGQFDTGGGTAQDETHSSLNRTRSGRQRANTSASGF